MLIVCPNFQHLLRFRRPWKRKHFENFTLRAKQHPKIRVFTKNIFFGGGDTINSQHVTIKEKNDLTLSSRQDSNLGLPERLAGALFIFIYLSPYFIIFFYLYKVGYVRELYLVPGKVHKMKTLSLRPALFGNQTVLNMNLLSILEFPPYLKVKVFLPF